MRREERVTVQGPVKEQQPDGMSNGGGGGGSICRLLGAADAQTAHHATSNSSSTPTTGLRERGNNTGRSIQHSPRGQNGLLVPCRRAWQDEPAFWAVLRA